MERERAKVKYNKINIYHTSYDMIRRVNQVYDIYKCFIYSYNII